MNHPSVIRWPELPPAALAFAACARLRLEPAPQLWIVRSLGELERLADCFRTFGARRVHLLRDPASHDVEWMGDTLEAIACLQEAPGDPFILLTTLQAFDGDLPDPSGTCVLRKGTSIPPNDLLLRLDAAGYLPDAEVVEKGVFARRGGILDIWPPASRQPIRIEWFGNEIDSLRFFDPSTQRSIGPADEARIPPMRPTGGLRLSDLLPPAIQTVFHGLPSDPFPFPLPRDTVPIETGHDPRTAEDLDLNAWSTGIAPISEDNPPQKAEQSRRQLFSSLHELARDGWQIDLHMETDGAAERVCEAYLGGRSTPAIAIHRGLLHGAFIAPQRKRIVIPEASLYGLRDDLARRRRDEALRTSSGKRSADWSTLEPGERVVHVDHGIGKYLGLVEMEMAGRRQEMLLLEYAEGQRIYLPSGQAHLLTRYTGLGQTPPPLHRLKGSRWRKERASAEAAIEDLAARLLETQAARSRRSGRPCGPDTHLQTEFEHAFPYLETPDQAEAARVVKADLESDRPMDRLLCGDAGYGKTEVAMRAAFKMVMDGRQVAVLVPTTILAQQHYDTFSERMAAFPVEIDLLCRFRSREAQGETIQRLRDGRCHIVIGTHRLLSGDVRFHNLGLVVIDEEQRFGVEAKERLKQLRCEVDVLTLSATPIPRTLYMSLTGTRDLSLIQTPPEERQPVETHVLEDHDDLVREAIEHELTRDGQLFFLHNRVRTIGRVADRVRTLVPDARVAIAHGQMGEQLLSDTMHRFVRGQIDVLVCTTIVESGLDIPQANTILIDRADRFGLADLYQLRGRVGRSRRKAYAFLLLPPDLPIPADSRERIEALQQHEGRGAGYRIAMRDLEIRGAGNLLGDRQSGHIAAIGFDLYCQLLKRSVARLQGKRIPPIIETAVDLDFIDRSPSLGNAAHGAFIPPDYAEDENLRVGLYGRIAALSTAGETSDLLRELTDRFGTPPRPLRNLFAIARIRIAAAEAGIQTVRTSDDRLFLLRNGNAIMPGGRYPRLRKRSVPARLKEILALIRAHKTAR